MTDRDVEKSNIYGTLGPACGRQEILEKMIACGMTGNAVEPEITLNAGLMGTGRYDVERGWMPGDRCIGVREEPVACQIGFAAAAFLSRTADHFDRSRQLVLFLIVFIDHRGGNRADA